MAPDLSSGFPDLRPTRNRKLTPYACVKARPWAFGLHRRAYIRTIALAWAFPVWICLGISGSTYTGTDEHRRSTHRRATSHRRKHPQITAVVALIRPISTLYEHGCIFLALALNCPKWLDFPKQSPASSVMVFGSGLRLWSSAMVFGLALPAASSGWSFLLVRIFPALLLPALLSRSSHFISAFISAMFNLSFSRFSALSAAFR